MTTRRRLGGALVLAAAVLALVPGCGRDDDLRATAQDNRPLPPFGQFGTMAVTVTRPDGTTVELCLLLADTDARRSRGLMEVTDLAGYDGMLFSWPEPTSSAFYMFNTVLPLSIAFYGEDGRFVSSADMDPCPAADVADCPLTFADGPYRQAVEVPQGQLTPLGMVEGSTLSVGGAPCRPR